MLTLLTLTVTVRVTLTLPTLLTLILDIGLSNPRIIEPSDYRYITGSFIADVVRIEQMLVCFGDMSN